MKVSVTSPNRPKGRSLAVNNPYGMANPIATGLDAPGVVHVELQGRYLTFTVELFEPWKVEVR